VQPAQHRIGIDSHAKTPGETSTSLITECESDGIESGRET